MVNNNNTYIKNLEGMYIFKSNYKNIDFDITSYNRAKLYSATMPFSLEGIRAGENEIYIESGKQYTDLFVNVKFDKNYYAYVDEKKELIAHKAEIREHIYKNGFTIIDGDSSTDYVFYKRGASKAKSGSDIFIKKSNFEKSINRSRLNIKFEENELMDKTSIHAYEALIMSGLEFVINLNPKTDILIIDDIYGKEFSSVASVTEIIDDKIVTNTKGIEYDLKLKNCLSDGQALLDECVFEEYKKNGKGFMLLRSDFMKACAFNTKLRTYWKNKNITEIVEKLDGIPTGRILDTTKLKLVITPNSLKWLKLSYKFSKEDNKGTLEDFNKLSNEEKIKVKIKCYLYWLNSIDNIFGIVKMDKQSNFGTANRMTYQLLNSLPLSYKDVEELAKDEIEYVMSLKNDFAIFKNHVGQNINEILRYEEDIDFVTNYRPEAVNIEPKYKTKDLVSALLSVNDDFRYTEKFKDWKKEQIEYYEGNLRRGKLRLKNTIYVTLFSNPFEMLQSTIGQYTEGTSLAEGREIWCPHYEDGIEFCLSRNPHVNMGNVAWAVNKKHKEYTDWFNLTPNCCVVNFANNDLPDRLQGCDTDSDQMLLLPFKKLADLAKDCVEKYPTPINRVKGEVKERFNNMDSLAELDQTLSNNYIGKIINKSQIINSYMWDAMAEGKDKELISIYYNQSSKLSSLSQIEIDKSKKSFDNISVAGELNTINNVRYNGKRILDFKFCKVVNNKEVEITEEEYDRILEDNKVVKMINLINKLKEKLEKWKKEGYDKKDENKVMRAMLKVTDLSKKIKKIDNKASEAIVVTKYLYVPRFFKYIAKDNTYRRFKLDETNKETIFNCPMDYLQDILDKEIKKPDATPIVKFKDLLIRQKTLKGTSDSRQVIAIYKIIEACGKKLNGLNFGNKKFNKNLTQKAKDTIKSNLKKNAIEELKRIKINSKTILLILRIAFGVSKHKTLRILLWQLLVMQLSRNYLMHMVI